MTQTLCNFCRQKPDVVTCTCNPSTFEDGVGLLQVGGNSPSVDDWIVLPPVI